MKKNTGRHDLKTGFPPCVLDPILTPSKGLIA